jgi:hypothetical protein
MMTIRISRRALWLASLVVSSIAGMIFGGVVHASFMSSSAAQIYACVTTGTGSIRIVSASDTCTASETALSWNQAGVPGPRGPAGPGGLVSNLTSAYLHQIDLRYRNLAGLNFSNSQLYEASLAGANMSGAKFIGTSLGSADLTDANLSSADLTNAGLGGSTIVRTNLFSDQREL